MNHDHIIKAMIHQQVTVPLFLCVCCFRYHRSHCSSITSLFLVWYHFHCSFLDQIVFSQSIFLYFSNEGSEYQMFVNFDMVCLIQGSVLSPLHLVHHSSILVLPFLTHLQIIISMQMTNDTQLHFSFSGAVVFAKRHSTGNSGNCCSKRFQLDVYQFSHSKSF